jgi:hypothetical protein
MTSMTLLIVKGDKRFVELPEEFEFQRLRMWLKIDTDGKLTMQLFDTQDDFNFSIVNFLICLAIEIEPHC